MAIEIHLKINTVIGVLLVGLTACQFTESRAAATPALLIKTSAESRAILERAISNILNGTPIVIGKKDFIENNKLTIQRSTRDPIGMAGLNGRLLGRPIVHHFYLLKQGGQCYLVEATNDKRHSLERIHCKAI